MCKDIILKAENISKQYRLGTVGTGTLSHDLNRWWHRIRGKEDPYLKIGETNDRSTKGTSDYVWALQDINFEVQRGEVLGIIGKNGAGKSTLLKILSKVTAPTTGSIKSRGRIASLLEVGTGFNGELTGRENVYLNGAILGMTKKEITEKLDEIIAFSGCERYIDTPVKRYSSGMTVRLAFAVAAFLEPEILVIDEVLAVGDAEFQKKAIGKMQDISKGEGRTVLFVSHNMAAVKSLCTRGIVMEQGKIVENNTIDNCLNYYFSNRSFKMTFKEYEEGNRPGSDNLELLSYRLLDSKNQQIDSFNLYENVLIEIQFRVIKKSDKHVFYPNLHFFDNEDGCLFTSCVSKKEAVSEKGTYKTVFEIPSYTFNSGIFQVGIAITSYPGTYVHFYINPAIVFEVMENDLSKREYPYTGAIPGLISGRLPVSTHSMKGKVFKF